MSTRIFEISATGLCGTTGITTCSITVTVALTPIAPIPAAPTAFVVSVLIAFAFLV